MSIEIGKMYRKALSYAYKLDRSNYKDLVHDAYISSKGKLFDNEFTMLRIVKVAWWRMLERKSQVIGGVTVWRQYEEFEDHRCNSVTPLDEVVGLESFENLRKQLTNQQLAILHYAQEGWDNVTISMFLGYTLQNIHYHRNQIKDKFTGSSPKQRVGKANHTTGVVDKLSGIRYNSIQEVCDLMGYNYDKFYSRLRRNTDKRFTRA